MGAFSNEQGYLCEAILFLTLVLKKPNNQLLFVRHCFFVTFFQQDAFTKETGQAGKMQCTAVVLLAKETSQGEEGASESKTKAMF